MKMPIDLKTRWLEALRSGEYKQAHGILMDAAGGYCCLGVLQCVADGEVEHNSEGNPNGLPSIAWRKNHGLVATEPDLITMFDPFITLNDVERKDFPAIADYIEENVEGV